MLTTLADIIANLLSVIDGKTTIFTNIYWLVLLPWWLILLPLSCRLCYCNGSWCCCSMFVVWLADVIAMVVDVITTQGVYIVWQMLRPYVWLMELPQVSIYFKFSSEMLSRTSSHLCGRWYLPMFLLKDGLFALMYRASFMVLKRFWSSLLSMVKLSMVTSWPEMLRWSYMGDGFKIYHR